MVLQASVSLKENVTKQGHSSGRQPVAAPRSSTHRQGRRLAPLKDTFPPRFYFYQAGSSWANLRLEDRNSPSLATLFILTTFTS